MQAERVKEFNPCTHTDEHSSSRVIQQIELSTNRGEHCVRNSKASGWHFPPHDTTKSAS